MPRYKSSERDENGGTVYKDVCNPITAEFREELFTHILEEYERVREQGQPERGEDRHAEPPQFSVTVTPYEREGSSIRGLARIYFEDSFIVNNVNILQGKEKVFVSMPSYKTKQKDENGKDIYQDICYPVTKEFREKLYGEIERAYQEAKEKQMEEARGGQEHSQIGEGLNGQGHNQGDGMNGQGHGSNSDEHNQPGCGNGGFIQGSGDSLPFR